MKVRNLMIAFVLVLAPLVASAQFSDLDTAMSNLHRGFGSGDPQAVVAGLASGDQVMLQFPGLMSQSGFFGRDQAAYLLDGLFNKVKPNGFEQTSARRDSSKGQYEIAGTWAISENGSPSKRTLYITLRNNHDKWSVVSIRSAGQ
jgi:hypothetical protein